MSTPSTKETTSAAPSPSTASSFFDPFQREAELQQQAQSWKISDIVDATPDEIPVLDLGPWLAAKQEQQLKQQQEQQQEEHNSDNHSAAAAAAAAAATTAAADALRDALAQQLRRACTRVGFFVIRHYGVEPAVRQDLLDAMREFFHLSEDEKMQYHMEASASNRTRHPPGTGYLPVGHYKLPARPHPNRNECFIVKQNNDTCPDLVADNPWPRQHQHHNNNNSSNLQQAATTYSHAMVHLAQQHLLPLFARALHLPADYFDKAFAEPSFRLRMTHYPPPVNNDNDDPADNNNNQNNNCGIHPHVDTSFCTILAQDSPGLVVQVERHGDDGDDNKNHNNNHHHPASITSSTTRWIRVPYDANHPNDLVVNVGEFLGRYWTNDTFVAAKHFVQQQQQQQPSLPNSHYSGDRYSIPFFFNAHAHYVMQCVPTCCSPEQPSKYPAVSYATSQAIAQGE